MSHRILLVEDEAVVALSERRILEKHDYEVIIAYRGEEAIRIVDADPGISLVLMDIDLGKGMDGTETAQHILEKHDLPIVFLSSHNERGIVKKTESITSYGYIHKNSGETVLTTSIKMAFRLFEAHRQLNNRREDLEQTLLQQKKTEEKLLRKTEELDLYFTSSMDMLCVADTKGFFIRLNPVWEEVLGYSLSDLEGRSFLDFIHPEDRQATLQAVGKLGNQEEILNFENRYRCKNGSYKWIEWRSKPVGTIIYATARDITDRKLHEQETQKWMEHLSISEARYRSLFHENPLGTFEYDGNGIIQECNDRFVEILGSAREKLIGFSLLNGLKDAEFLEQIKHSLREGAGYYEGNYTSVTGRNTTPVRAFFRGIRDKDGSIRSGLGLIEDITDRKEAEITLSEKTEFLRNITDNMLDLIALTDLEGNFTFVGASHSILGYNLQSLIGKNVLDFVHPDDLPQIQTALYDALRRMDNYRSVEYRYRRADGGYVWLETAGKILTDPAGKPKELLFSSRDITRRKADETALKISEARYKHLFDNSAISLWEEDISEVLDVIDRLKREGITDFDSHFIDNPDLVKDLIGRIRIIDVNDAAVKMYGAQTKDMLLGSLEKTLYPTEQTLLFMKNELVAITRQNDFIEGEIHAKNLLGGKMDLMVRINFFYEPDLKSTMIVAISDISLLKRTIEEKDELMRELNHRIKNNLAMVGSLIRLKDDELGESADLSDIHHQMDAIRLIHEKLYQNEEISRIAVRDYLEDLIRSVFSTFSSKPVTVDSSIEDTYLNSKTAMYVGLLVNEAATNAIKHGFNSKEEARFSIRLTQDKSKRMYTLVLSNTGNPFPEEIDPEHPESLGLQIISTLVKQLEGILILEKHPHPVYTITFPIDEDAE